MHCVKCGYETTRVQTSNRYDGHSFRIRLCMSCGFRFKTKEVYEKEVKQKESKKYRPTELNENILHFNFEKGN